MDEIRDKAELCSTDCCKEDEEERMIPGHYRFVSLAFNGKRSGARGFVIIREAKGDRNVEGTLLRRLA